MSSKPNIPIERIRQKIREALKLADGDPLTEGQIHEAVVDLLGRDPGLQAIRDGIEWNHGEAYVRSEFIAEAEKTAWFITKAGIAKENIK